MFGFHTRVRVWGCVLGLGSWIRIWEALAFNHVMGNHVMGTGPYCTYHRSPTGAVIIGLFGLAWRLYYGGSPNGSLMITADFSQRTFGDEVGPCLFIGLL